MTIYLSDKNRYDPADSYEEMLKYTTTLFGFTYDDYLALCSNPVISSKKVIWYIN